MHNEVNVGLFRFCRRATLALVFCTAAVAASGAALTAEDCMQISDSVERVACYDRLHGRNVDRPLQQRASSGSVTGSQKPTTQALVVEPTIDGGTTSTATRYELGAEQLSKSRAERQAQSKPSELVSMVVARGVNNARRHWFRLDNGQLWEQKSIETTNIREGDKVRIRRSTFGAYVMRLADGGSRSTRVKRRE